MSGLQVVFISGWAHGVEAMAPLAEALGGTYPVFSTSPGTLFLKATRKEAFPADTLERELSTYGRAIVGRIRNTDGPVCVAAWSTGGMVAMEAALALPDKVAALVLLSTTAKFCSQGDYSHGVSQAALRGMCRRIRRDPATVLGDFFSLAVFPRSIRREPLKRRIDCAMRLGMEPLVHGLDYLQQTDLRAGLESLVQPCLVIHGREDRIIPWGAADFLGRNIATCESDILPDTGHMLIEQRLEVLVDRIRGFLENLP